MSAITVLSDAGVQAEVVGSSLKLRGLKKLTAEQRKQIIEFARDHKAALIAAIYATGTPGQCESCPAAGYWDYAQYAGQGLLCFFKAYFQGRTGKPKPCSAVRPNCPRAVTGRVSE